MAKPRGEKTSPKYAGADNMKGIKVHGNRKADDSKVDDLAVILKMKKERPKIVDDNGKRYFNSDNKEWTAGELEEAIDSFFEWCVDYAISPSVPLLAIWLQCSKKTVWEWEFKENDIGCVIRDAMNTMETLFWNDLDNKCEANKYRLRTKMGKDYTEKSQLEISSEVKAVTDDELIAAVEKLW